MGTHRPIDIDESARLLARLRRPIARAADSLGLRHRSGGASPTVAGDDKPLVVLDVNNFFSPTGGGVRRYHLEKIAHFGPRADIDYHLVVPSDRRERVSDPAGATLHHLPAVAIGKSGYRFLVDPFALRRLIQAIDPDVIEIGSPYILPDLVRYAARGSRAKLIGFWHAHYPDAYLRRPLTPAGEVATVAERVGWWWARRTFGRFDRTVAAAHCLEGELGAHGIDQVAITPLGVDLALFSPARRDEAMRSRWGAGADDVVFAFSHRLCEEKRLGTLLEAWPIAAALLGRRARLVFAGRGPGEAQARALAARYPGQVYFEGFLGDREAMASLLASVDVVLALSPTETFGLSAAEAMASGAALIGSEELSVGEMLRQSRAGVGVPDRDPHALAAAIVQMSDGSRVRTLGQRAHAYALSRFDWRETFERLSQIYRSACEGRPAPTMEPRDAMVAALATSGGGAIEARWRQTNRRPPATDAAAPVGFDGATRGPRERL